MRSSPWKRRQLLHSSPNGFNHVATVTPSSRPPHDFKDHPIVRDTQQQKSKIGGMRQNQAWKATPQNLKRESTPASKKPFHPREGIAIFVQILLRSYPARSCYGPFC